MSKFAVIKTGGKQYLVETGDVLKVEKLAPLAKGDKVIFDEVLLLDDGKTVTIGNPFIKGAKVEAKYEGEERSKKVTIIKFKRKTRYTKKQGHRQIKTKVTIGKI